MSIADYSFEKRLARAATLPSSWYTDPEMLALEKHTVFGCAWQLVGRAEQVARPGNYFTASIADEPIIVARGEDETVRALSNVCRHRAGPVAAGSGTRRAFQCGYGFVARMLSDTDNSWLVVLERGQRVFVETSRSD